MSNINDFVLRYIYNKLDNTLTYSDMISLYRKQNKLQKEQIYRILFCREYSGFLKTNYWNCITKEIKGKRKKCQLCGSKVFLQVHHKTYKNKGKEHMRTVQKGDLLLLCGECHKKQHRRTK